MKVNSKSPYYSLSQFFKKEFGGKVKKVSLDAGFSCPHRNKNREGGCYFCDPFGSGPENDPSKWFEKLSIETSLFLKKGYKGVIAYFQAFSNTYDSIKKLSEMYSKALGVKGVIGLAVGTRPDLISDEIVSLFSELNQKSLIWVELGMQTKFDKTLKLLNRGHTHYDTVKAVDMLKSKNIKIVLHLIAGLPNETKEMMFESFYECARLRPWGVKLHPLHIVKGSVFEKWYYEGKIKLLELEEYVELAANFIKILPPDTVIHRITGERREELLIAPKWCLDKNRVLNEIRKRLETLY